MGIPTLVDAFVLGANATLNLIFTILGVLFPIFVAFVSIKLFTGGLKGISQVFGFLVFLTKSPKGTMFTKIGGKDGNKTGVD